MGKDGRGFQRPHVPACRLRSVRRVRRVEAGRHLPRFDTDGARRQGVHRVLGGSCGGGLRMRRWRIPAHVQADQGDPRPDDAEGPGVQGHALGRHPGDHHHLSRALRRRRRPGARLPRAWSSTAGRRRRTATLASTWAPARAASSRMPARSASVSSGPRRARSSRPSRVRGRRQARHRRLRRGGHQHLRVAGRRPPSDVRAHQGHPGPDDAQGPVVEGDDVCRHARSRASGSSTSGAGSPTADPTKLTGGTRLSANQIAAARSVATGQQTTVVASSQTPSDATKGRRQAPRVERAARGDPGAAARVPLGRCSTARFDEHHDRVMARLRRMTGRSRSRRQGPRRSRHRRAAGGCGRGLFLLVRRYRRVAGRAARSACGHRHRDGGLFVGSVCATLVVEALAGAVGGGYRRYDDTRPGRSWRWCQWALRRPRCA